MTTARGKFIALEGIDGAGTTTQGSLLEQALNGRGIPAHITCEPSTGPVGKVIRQALRLELGDVDPAVTALLFAADRVDHLRREVEPLLARGTHVITDRYVYSSLAYQGVDLERQWVAVANRLATEPDLTLYLRVEPELALERRAARGGARELFDADETQVKVAATYDQLFGGHLGDGSWSLRDGPGPGLSWQQRPHTPRQLAADLGRIPTWAVLDGALPPQQIHEQISALVNHIVGLEEDPKIQE